MGWSNGAAWLSNDGGWYKNVAAGPAYVGPGDINGAAVVWGGLRAFNAAYATGSNPAVDLVDQAGANPITINILSNGNLDNASIGTWVTAHSVTTIKVSKLYDQSGNSHHLVQATLALMPPLVLSASGLAAGKYSVNFNAASALSTAATIGSNSQPVTVSTAYRRDAAGSTFGWLMQEDSGGNNFIPEVNIFIMQSSSSGLNVTASDSIFHGVQALYNGTSSSAYVDGTLTTGAGVGTNLFGGHIILGALDATASDPLQGWVQEFGIWGSDKTANNSTMNSNQHTYWGF